MSRLLLFLALLVLAVAIAALLLSIWRSAVSLGQDMARPMMRAGERGRMAPNGLQKTAYLALLALLFGLATGLIGGL